jgi:hypothetical protein
MANSDFLPGTRKYDTINLSLSREDVQTMSTMKNAPMRHQAVILHTSDDKTSRLVIEVPPEQEQAIQDALETLSQMETGISAQTVVLDALRIAAEQTYFWTPEWQAKEQAADRAIAEGRVRTFDTMDQMLDFLDAQ